MSRTAKIIGIVLVTWAILALIVWIISLIVDCGLVINKKKSHTRPWGIALLGIIINLIILVVGIILIATNRESIEKCADCQGTIHCKTIDNC